MALGDIMSFLFTVIEPKHSCPCRRIKSSALTMASSVAVFLAVGCGRETAWACTAFVMFNKNSSGDSERELLYDDNIHVEASAYAH